MRFSSLLVLLTACGTGPQTATGVTTVFQLRSEVADDTYDILVRVPQNYDTSGRSYPIVYQLDATFLGEMDYSAGVISELEAARTIGEVIIVGIGHRASNNRERGRFTDFVVPDPNNPKSTDRAPLFYRFLRDELAPKVETDYRVELDAGRTLIGHSLGGLFALYAFFQDSADGTPFLANAIAADPSYGTNDGAIFAHEASYAATHSARTGRLFLTASMFTGGSQKFPHEEMVRRISRDLPSVSLKSSYVRTTHGGLIPTSMSEGIPFVLGGTQ